MAMRPVTTLIASLCAITITGHAAMAVPNTGNTRDYDLGLRGCIIGDEPPCRGAMLHSNRLLWHGSLSDRRDDTRPPIPRVRPKGIGKAIGTTGTNRNTAIVATAQKYVGLSERSNRKTLGRWLSSKLRMHIDPVITPWCAAFVNAILTEVGLPTSGSNLGSSFAKYGRKVSDPKPGDIVVLRMGRHSRNHVGIYVGTEMRGKRKFVKVLGGNQSNRVQVSSYDASRIVAIRRPG